MKKKSPAEIWAEEMFNSPPFQAKWQSYIELFGYDLNCLFPDSYRNKLVFANALKQMAEEQYEDALSTIKSFEESCTTEEELSILNGLMADCKSKIAPPVEPQMSARYLRFKELLLANGMQEASKASGHFYRETADHVAFAVNLTDDEVAVTVLYGFSAIPQMIDDSEYFNQYGADDDTCHVRKILAVWDEESELAAAEIIGAFYQRYQSFSKEEILAEKKELQKAFLAHFARALKPLGFKKKGTTWTRELSEGRMLTFNAQKSAWSDQYYFNVSVHAVDQHWSYPVNGRSLCERVVLTDSDIYNWQIMSEEQIQNLVDCTLNRYILPKLN